MSLRVGVIGLGIGQTHLEKYAALPSVEIAAVADLSPARLEEAAYRYKCRGYTSGHELIAAEKLDIVSICTNPATHCELALAAMERGVNVLVEKPTARSLAEFDAMQEAAERHGVKWMTGFKMRFEPLIPHLRGLLAKGGTPFTVIWRRPIGRTVPAFLWDENDGQGPIVENMAHAVNTLLYLFGDVNQVYAQGGRFLQTRSEVEDAVSFILRLKTGGLVSISGGCISEWSVATEDMAVYTPEAVIEVKGPVGHPKEVSFHERGGGRVETLQFLEYDGFGPEIEHFVSCVTGDTPPLITPEEARRTLQVCLEVRRSLKEGRPLEL